MSKQLTKTIIKTGNSLYVVIPAQFANKVGLKPGDKALVSYDLKKKKVVYSFPASRQLSLI
jgi:antitoxin component of MazEF toxin-antitoxin module